jgi:hypothetical protein
MWKLEHEISQEPELGVRLRREDELAGPSLKLADAVDKVKLALKLNLAKWDEADRAAEVANRDGSSPEDARIGREGYLRADLEAEIWSDSTTVDRGLRGEVDVLAKARARLVKAELEFTEKGIAPEYLQENLQEARAAYNTARSDLNFALDTIEENERTKALIVAVVANRDGKHKEDLLDARLLLLELEAATLVLKDTSN